jgi:adenylate cyclase
MGKQDTPDVLHNKILHGKILIVDDMQANVLLLERILRSAGYVSITSTMNPREVCNLHIQNHYDLILLDLEMPGMDGFQVMEGLQEIEADGYLPVLIITAQPSHKLRALELGAKDFISKPFDIGEVIFRVHNMLEVRLLYRESRTYGKVLASWYSGIFKRVG